MKATERHRLKTNELAESLNEGVDYLRQHQSKVLGVAAVVLIAAAGGLWWWQSQAAGALQRQQELQQQLLAFGQMQVEAAMRAQQALSPDETSQEGMLLAEAYYPTALASTLGSLAQGGQGTSVGMIALLQQAEAVRSELLFADREISNQERDDVCQRAEKLYNQVLTQYGNDPVAVGMGNLGLGLIAEERADWTKAKETYEAIVAKSDGILAGTIFPLQANRRLAMLEKISVPIEFPEAVAPLVEPVSEQAGTTMEGQEAPESTEQEPDAAAPAGQGPDAANEAPVQEQ